METGAVPDVQSIFNQWREGTILNAEERRALRLSRVNAAPRPAASDAAFADLLKQASDDTPTTLA